MAAVNTELESVYSNHKQIWRTLQEHDIIIDKLKAKQQPSKSVDLRHRNVSQNARLDTHYVYDERKRDNHRIKELGKY